MLDAQSMIREARAITGLHDFDRDDVERNLARVVDAVDTEAGVNAQGEIEPEEELFLQKSDFTVPNIRDTLADPIPAMRLIYDFYGLAFTPEAERAVRDHDERNRQHQHGKHDYTLDEYGCTRERIEAAFRPCLDRYGDLI